MAHVVMQRLSSDVVLEHPPRILETFHLEFFFIALKHTSLDRAHRAASNEVDLISGTRCRANRYVKNPVEDSF